ncbi:MAG: filamentous hemagglutinin N-terminal domain-containing protein [Cyanobacteria bacterium P01_G01_bin.39]
MKTALFFPLQVSLYTVGCLFATNNTAQAQVTTDGTVGTIVNQNSNVAEITGGETREGNLFHSFQDFSVDTGNEAFFNNANNIANIFSRVTGGNISTIDGLIRANGSASLFLINPAGIILGENASLNIGGSFYGSSASSILFEDGEFSAADLDNPPLLTVNAPIGLSFRDNPGNITVKGTGQGIKLEDGAIIDPEDALQVNPNQTFALAGGNMLFEGAAIKAEGGRIELGSVAGNQQVSLSSVEEGFSFGYDGVQSFGDIKLSQGATIDVSGEGGGEINVSGNNISIGDLLNNDNFITGFSGFTSLTSGSSSGKDINIFAQGSLNISGIENNSNFVSGIFSQTIPGRTADAGDINITAQTLKMDNNARLATRNEGMGNAGNVTLDIADSILISNEANINTQTTGFGTGNAGDVDITSNTLELQGKANIAVNKQKKAESDIGNSGNIKIETNESVILNNSNLTTTIFPDTKGKGDTGNIYIKSPEVSLTDNAVISVSNSGDGNIGNINVASDKISVDNFSLITASSRFNSDLAPNNTNISSGSITLNSKKVSLTRGGIIDVSTANQIDGGSININADILEIFSGGVLQAATEGTGNAGTVNLNVSNSITIDGNDTPNRPSEFDFADEIINSREGTTGVFANAQVLRDTVTNVGNAGNIVIEGNTFELGNNARLAAFYTGNGNERNGGNVTLDISDSVVINNGASINVEVPQSAIGNAGNIKINANTFKLSGQPFGNRANILADNDGQGNSGTIEIETQKSVFIDNSSISSRITEGAEGNSGEIMITSPQVSLTNNGVISVSSSGNAEGGNININSDQISVDNFSLIAASSRTKGSEGSGNIILNSGTVTLSNGGVINATTASEDNAGQITINAEILELFSGGVLQTATEGNGNAGNITLNISDYIV